MKIKSTRSSEKADYIFINSIPNKTCNHLTNQEVEYSSYRRAGVRDSGIFLDVTKISDEAKAVVEYLYEVEKTFDVLITYETLEKIRNFTYEIHGNHRWIPSEISYNFVSLKSPSLFSKLRHQDELIPLINGDSMIITDEKMAELQAMFDSGDTDNIVLAMEIMANSNHEQSILNNYILLVNNLNKIAQAKESSHRNFQSFLTFYELDLRYMRNKISYKDSDYIANLLKDYGKLTKESMEKVLKFYADNNHQYVGNYCNSVLVSNHDIIYDI
jgi:uncharacterized protein (DUF433 family)